MTIDRIVRDAERLLGRLDNTPAMLADAAKIADIAVRPWELDGLMRMAQAAEKAAQDLMKFDPAHTLRLQAEYETNLIRERNIAARFSGYVDAPAPRRRSIVRRQVKRRVGF